MAEKNAIVTTSTFYDLDNHVSKTRAEIAREAIRHTLEAGYQVYIVDGGSPASLLDEFEGWGAKVYAEQQKGMGPARRQIIRFATEQKPRAILWTEPEKDLSRNLDKILDPILTGTADFVNVKRENLSSYPVFQQQTEGIGNEFWKTITGTSLDMFFGARAWHPKLSKYFLEYEGMAQDAIHIPVIDIIRAGHRAVSVTIDYTYPAAQREVEEGLISAPEMQLKRLQQLQDLSKLTLNRWNYLNTK